MQVGDIVGWQEPYREDGALISRWGEVVDMGEGWVTAAHLHDEAVSGLDTSAIHCAIKSFKGL